MFGFLRRKKSRQAAAQGATTEVSGGVEPVDGAASKGPSAGSEAGTGAGPDAQSPSIFQDAAQESGPSGGLDPARAISTTQDGLLRIGSLGFGAKRDTPIPARDVNSVVRDKVDDLAGSQPALSRVRARGVSPMWVPPLDEVALEYRLEAAGRSGAAPGVRVEWWLAYLALVPSDVDAWMDLGRLLIQLEAFDSAREAFVCASALSPDDGLIASAVGYCAMQQGDWTVAVQSYEAAVALRPGCQDMLRGLARALDAAGHTAHADAVYAQLEGDAAVG